MTELERRTEKLEDRYHLVDKRQESFEIYTKQRQDSFEDFVRSYIDINEKRLERMDAKFDKMEAKIDALSAKFDSKFDSLMKFMQSMTITAMIGMLGIAGSVVYFVYNVTPKP